MARRWSQGAKTALDIAMLLVLALLVSRSLSGTAPHEYLGIAFFVLAVLHNVGNGSFWKSLDKGHWTRTRWAVAVPPFALVVLIVMLLFTVGPLSVALPLRLPSFLGTWQARSVHAGLAVWIYLVALVHAGTMCGPRFVSWWRSASVPLHVLAGAAFVLLLALGIYDFVMMKFPAHLAFSYGFEGMEIDGPLANGVLEVLVAGVPAFALGAAIRVAASPTRCRKKQKKES